MSFQIDPKGNDVLLTVAHRRLPDRGSVLNVSTGWHAHLDVLAARLAGRQTRPFWEMWSSLKQDCERRIPA